MVGVVAHEEGLFHRAGRTLEGLPGGGSALFAACVLLVTVVTAILNLDTFSRRGLLLAPLAIAIALLA
jgi:Na+/H+ antiporter NhaD/arsenite permease-like protein